MLTKVSPRKLHIDTFEKPISIPLEQKSEATYFPELLTERTEYESCGTGVLMCFLICLTGNGSNESPLNLPVSDMELLFPRDGFAVLDNWKFSSFNSFSTTYTAECSRLPDGVGRGAIAGRDLESNSQTITPILVPVATKWGCKGCATIQ